MNNGSKQQPERIDNSLGDQVTGDDVSRADEERSLGDQSTTGDALSSMSNLMDDLGEAIDSDLPLVDLAARYEIEGELGKGGMGTVLLATDRQLKRKVAIKRILDPMAQSKTALQRFVTEAQSIAALNHFNIVQVYEFGRDAEGPFLVLEYADGGSLFDKLKKGKLEVEEAVDITCQLCDGLSKAHGAGITHRDIKPANILLTVDGQPKLTDFGLARQETADHDQTQAGAALGTIDFMPPEQRRDATAVDARSDLWSLAATLYQMITGNSPKVIRLDQLPSNLAPVIGRMLEEDPDKRYATAEEFKAELRKGMTTVTATVSADLLSTASAESKRSLLSSATDKVLAKPAYAFEEYDDFEQSGNAVYRALSMTAVVSVGFACLGLTALIFPALLFLPLIGLIFGLVSLVKLHRYRNELTGKPVAIIGTLVSVVLLVSASSLHAFIYVTEVPEGYQRVNWYELQGTNRQPMNAFAVEINEKPIFIKGYVHPGVDGFGNIRHFVLVPDMKTCCFGGQPKPWDMIEITLAKDCSKIKYSTTKRKLWGVFKLGPETSKKIGDVRPGIYRMTADDLH